MKGRGKKRVVRAYHRGDWLTLNEVATLLAQRDQRSGEELRQGKDRWRKRIEYAVKANKLMKVEKLFKIDDLAAWARTLKVSGVDWLTKLDDLPRPTLRDSVEEIASVNDEEQGIRLPDSLEDCHEELRRLRSENRDLKQEIEQLREPAAKYVALCINHQEAARKRQN
ncbi:MULTISPECIES: hypothetical protein [Aeromonas]|uniref:hypothetical protein n=1 Tax=Aeromonas TaxID=642 RepID=UPI0012EEBD8E|nr:MULTISPECIES: hypothetical protein [Aeromonas]QXC29905.1 hypothetical protein I6L39_18945 [Aeromonas sp. FDAARGOS 1409]